MNPSYDMLPHGVLGRIATFLDFSSFLVFEETCKTTKLVTRSSEVVCNWLQASDSSQRLHALRWFFARMTHAHKSEVIRSLSVEQAKDALYMICDTPGLVDMELVRALINHLIDNGHYGRNIVTHLTRAVQNMNDDVVEAIVLGLWQVGRIHFIDETLIVEASQIHTEEYEVSNSFRVLVDAAAQNYMTSMLGRSLKHIVSRECLMYVLRKGATVDAAAASEIILSSPVKTLELASRLVRQCTNPQNLDTTSFVLSGFAGPVNALLDIGAPICSLTLNAAIIELQKKSQMNDVGGGNAYTTLLRRILDLLQDATVSECVRVLSLAKFSDDGCMGVLIEKLPRFVTSYDKLREMYVILCEEVDRNRTSSFDITDALGKVIVCALDKYRATNPNDRRSPLELVAMYHPHHTLSHSGIYVLVRNGFELMEADVVSVTEAGAIPNHEKLMEVLFESKDEGA